MKQHQAWADEYLRQLDDCELRESRLSDWERRFIDSLRKQLEEGRAPTPKQIESLDKTWERVTR